jgi:hypothetical protein
MLLRQRQVVLESQAQLYVFSDVLFNYRAGTPSSEARMVAKNRLVWHFDKNPT